MDDKKSLVIIGFLIAIIILLASFFLFLVSGSNPSPTAAYSAAVESETAVSSEAETAESPSQTEKESTKAIIKEATKKAKDETKKAQETREETSLASETSQAETIPEPQTTKEASAADAVIPCSGTLEIIRAGDHGEGIVFHAKPQFDAADAPGNVMKTEGTYPVDGKVYVKADDGNTYLMYKIGDYYVTSSQIYVSYLPDEAGKGAANPEWVREYADDVGAYVTIYSLDDTHVVFDTGAETSSGKRNVLNETVATFVGSNKAEFEYMADDQTQHTGSITFKNVEGRDDVYEVILSYASPIWYPGETGSVTELKVYN